MKYLITFQIKKIFGLEKEKIDESDQFIFEFFDQDEESSILFTVKIFIFYKNIIEKSISI
jgi:hypothetical protein